MSLRLSANLKVQIVLEALREDKSVAQIASENRIHPNQLHKRKKQALENFSQLFEDDRQGIRPIHLCVKKASVEELADLSQAG